MSTNKSLKKALMSLYGKGSMYQLARIDEVIAVKFGKTYAEYEKTCPYNEKRKKSMKAKYAYHHLQHTYEEGNTTLENGAVVTVLEHAFIHSLPREEEEFINRELRVFKENYLKWYKEYTTGKSSWDDEER